jgi:hypothetical protein
MKKINSKSETLNPKQYLITKFQKPKLFRKFEFRISNLFRISILGFSIYLGLSAPALAMGGRPPAPTKEASAEKPKYKLEVLKIERITTPTPEASKIHKTKGH